ncbi:MAG: hypothetical protein ACRCTU_17355, partial [Zoogloea sp.]
AKGTIYIGNFSRDDFFAVFDRWGGTALADRRRCMMRLGREVAVRIVLQHPLKGDINDPKEQ